MHHASIRTGNIHRAIAFYEQIGFTLQEQFTTGYTLACWMQGLGGRIELIEIPEPKPTPDAFGDEHYVGFYHLSFDLTDITPNLPNWLNELSLKLRKLDLEDFSFNILLKPCQQMIGDQVYEVAFIADTDGLPLEFIRRLGKVAIRQPQGS